MPRTSILIVIACLSSIGAAAADRPAPGEAKLARVLEGRVAARPVNCITLRRIRSSRIIDRTAIVFEGGGTLYVNRPPSGAESLSDSHVLVTKSPTGQICRGEVVQLFEPASTIQAGTASLGEFVPYRTNPPVIYLPPQGSYSKSGY